VDERTLSTENQLQPGSVQKTDSETKKNTITIRYDTIEEINVDSKAEYTA